MNEYYKVGCGAIAKSVFCNYLTSNKRYEILSINGDLFTIKDDGDEIICLVEDCSHSISENWEFIE